jgi:hypothetical protein
MAKHGQVQKVVRFGLSQRLKNLTYCEQHNREPNSSCGDCVIVKPQDDSDRDWKAQVHEVRAADEHQVFRRCSWLENPEDLPEEVRSTSSYHGSFELVPSNKMDIIDGLTANGRLDVTYWEEADDEATMPAQGEYYWRQTYDHDTKILSPSISFLKMQPGDRTDS